MEISYAKTKKNKASNSQWHLTHQLLMRYANIQFGLHNMRLKPLKNFKIMLLFLLKPLHRTCHLYKN